jgi:hypothetical protein
LFTCAWLNPLRPEVKEKVAQAGAAAGTPSDVTRALWLAAALWYAPSSTNDRTAEPIKLEVLNERRGLAKDLLAFAFAKKRSRVVVYPDGVVGIVVESKVRSDEAFGVPKDRFRQFEPYWQLLEDAVSRGDVTGISQLAPWSATRSGLNALQLELGDASTVSVVRSAGTGIQTPPLVLSRSTGVPWVVLTRTQESEAGARGTLDVRWIDRFGQELEGSLVALQGRGSRVSFPKEF